MAIALVSHIIAGPGVNGGTTSSINTTGANCLIVGAEWDQGATPPTVSDSKSNTWTPLTSATSGSGPKIQFYYVLSATVGTGHTFTISGSGSVPTISVSAWSGVKTSAAFDAQNTATGATFTLSTGSVSPSEDNELLVTTVGSQLATVSGISINGGFTVLDSIGLGGGNNYALVVAYLIQTSAASANPQWSDSNFGDLPVANIATFKVAAGAATLPPGQSTGMWDW